MSSTVVAISTGSSKSAIAIVRLTGENSAAIAGKVFNPISKEDLTRQKGYKAFYGTFHCHGKDIDDGVVIIYRAPKSYTGEDMAELCCHGNPLITAKIMSQCIEMGATPAGAGEFTKRAFLNGKLDLSQAEAVSELILAESEGAAAQALKRREGGLGKEVDSICDMICSLSAEIGVWVDYPEEEDAPFISYERLYQVAIAAKERLNKLLGGYQTGAFIDKGISIAIVGSPNVGKSTLSNLLSNSQRSIVTEIAGTTRDVVEAPVEIKGIGVKLLDTAGIRDSGDVVEQIGIERSKSALATADLVICVIDSSKKLQKEDFELLDIVKTKTHIIALNKADLPSETSEIIIENAVKICAANGEGIEELKEQILSALQINLSQDNTLIASHRQYDCIVRASAALALVEQAVLDSVTFDAIGILLDDVLAPLLELVGKSVTGAVTDEIFSKFCVGK